MSITALEFLVLALAAYRAARALALDSITEPLRDGLMRWSWEKDSETGEYLYVHPVKGRVAELVSCGFCSGFWLSGVTYAAWLTATSWDGPVLIHLIMWWAIAGAQALFICLDSFLLTMKESVDDES